MVESTHVALRIGCHDSFEPYIYKCAIENNLKRTRSCRYPGIFAEYLDVILTTAGIDYNVIPDRSPNSTEIEAKYGFAEMIIESVKAGYMDTYCSLFSTTPERTRRVQATYPILEQDSGLSALAPIVNGANRHDHSLWESSINRLAVFDRSAWLLIGLVLVFYQVFLRLINKMTSTENSTDGLKVSLHVSRKSISLMLVWMLFLLALFGSLYSNGLLSALLVPQMKPLFVSLAELIDILQTGHFGLIIDFGTASFANMYNYTGQNEQLQRLATAVRKMQLIDARRFDLNWTKAVQYSHSRHSDLIPIGPVIQVASAAREFPDFEPIRMPELDLDTSVLLLPQNLSKNVLDQLNTAIMSSYRSFQAIDQRYRQYLFDRGPAANVPIRIRESVDWTRFQGVFLLLLLGCVSSVGLLVTECFISILKHQTIDSPDMVG